MIEYEGANYLTPNEAARLLSIHISTIYSWCKHKEVALIDPFSPICKLRVIPSKYLIEEKSLRERHAHVHLDAK